MKNLPKRPYLLRALYEWLLDSELTPYLLVSAEGEGLSVPQEYIADGRIVLNISPNAVRNLDIGPDAVSFDGRFAGKSFAVYLPLFAVTAIYAKETGEGMLFEEERQLDGGNDDPEPPSDDPSGRGGLKLVK